MFPFGATFRTITLWTMIPLTFLSGIPVFGCVCASGQLKLLCPGMNDAADTAPQSYACCREMASQAAPSKFPPRCSVPGADRGAANSSIASRCCTKVVEWPQPSVAGKNLVRSERDYYIAVLPGTDTSPLCARKALVVAKNFRADLPPPDLLIEHQVFLI